MSTQRSTAPAARRSTFLRVGVGQAPKAPATPRASVVALVGAVIALVFLYLTPPLEASNDQSVARDNDKVADYGVCRGTNPRCYNTWDTAFRRDNVWRILIYSRTGVSRHA